MVWSPPKGESIRGVETQGEGKRPKTDRAVSAEGGMQTHRRIHSKKVNKRQQQRFFFLFSTCKEGERRKEGRNRSVRPRLFVFVPLSPVWLLFKSTEGNTGGLSVYQRKKVKDSWPHQIPSSVPSRPLLIDRSLCSPLSATYRRPLCFVV